MRKRASHASRRASPSRRSASARARWSQRVTRESHALDLAPEVFTWHDPHEIALSLKHSAERSRRRKAPPFRSAMSMLTFYVNRAGRQLSADQRARLETAKDELRALFGRPRRHRSLQLNPPSADKPHKPAQ